MTLSHSRHQFLYPVVAEDAMAWLAGHVAAFAFFGGTPQRLVPDNLTAGIAQADRYDPRANRAYGELARYYGCLIDPARVARPQDKPRVERGVSYARESFFRGRVLGTLATMRAEAARWCREIAGQRLHGTTGERPIDRFERDERQALHPLPARPLVVRFIRLRRQVAHDALVDVETVRYSVPHGLIRRTVEVDLGEQTVRIFHAEQLVATHGRSFERHSRVVDPEHFRGHWRPQTAEAAISESLAALGRSLEAYAEVVS